MPTATLPATDVQTQIELLERRVKQLELQVTGTANADAVRTLRELFEYALLRPVDLVKLDGHPYFMYVKDLAYTLFAEHQPDSFIRNYQLTDDDGKAPTPFPFSVEDFLEGRTDPFPRNEHYAKLIICAHLWRHDVDFAMLDVGANIGYSSVPCAKFFQRFTRTNRIHAFEPGMTRDLLVANLELNGVSGLVRPDHRAVSNRCGPVAMNSMLGHSVCDSINDFRKHYPTMVPALAHVVNTITVDAFVREQSITGKIFMKVDAEGHDLQVLEGAAESFANGQVAATIIEFVPHYLKEFIEPAQVLIDLAREHHLLYILDLTKGYHWTGHALPEDPAQLREFTKSVARSPLTYTDIVAISKRVPSASTLVRRLCSA